MSVARTLLAASRARHVQVSNVFGTAKRSYRTFQFFRGPGSPAGVESKNRKRSDRQHSGSVKACISSLPVLVGGVLGSAGIVLIYINVLFTNSLLIGNYSSSPESSDQSSGPSNLNSTSDVTSKKNVVIVGGGGAGASLARTLSKQLDPTKHSLILISSTDHFLHLLGVLRMIITSQGKLEDRVLVPYDKLFHNNNGTFHQATVTSIVRRSEQGGHVVTDQGEKIPFDVLVLASGSRWEGGIDIPVRRDEDLVFYPGMERKIQSVEEYCHCWWRRSGNGYEVTIYLTVELAGEIRDTYEGKKITIVHGQPHLLSSVYPESFRTTMDSTLRVVTEKGVRLDADLVVPTRGGAPILNILQRSGALPSTAGFVKVDPMLQVTGSPGIFAAGDILDWKEVKQYVKGQFHVATLSTNILSYLNGQPRRIL
ncbi:FAD/NAD(P)-binding domain-containing protein [Ramaria rubella]|nr:FAD/NAD(P)-binding domain-containing protein [Ramaria rubella]